MIEFHCEACGAPVRIGDEFGGKKGRCPSCGAVIDIPAQSDPAVAKAAPAPAPGPTPQSPAPMPPQPAPAAAPAFAPLPGAPRPRMVVPRYGGVTFLGYMFICMGILMCVMGLLVFLAAAIGGAGASYAMRGRAMPVGFGASMALIGLIYGGFIGIWGLMGVGMGFLVFCIRDMAQNTFYLRRI
jgi:hypothetical protein